jgi:hypothetical protein
MSSWESITPQDKRLFEAKASTDEHFWVVDDESKEPCIPKKSDGTKIAHLYGPPDRPQGQNDHTLEESEIDQIFAVQTPAKKNQEDTRPVDKALMKVAERLGARNGFGRLMRRAKVHGLPVPTLSANSRLCAFGSISVMVNVAALFLATRSAGHAKKMFAAFGVAIQAMLLASATDSVVNGDGFMAWKREVNVSHVVRDWTKAFLSVRDGGSKQTEAMKF